MAVESGRRHESTSLPSQLATFVGRQQELDDLERLLAANRLVTLTGTGGSGKTRLALEVGARVGDRFPEGVVFVDLAPIGDAELVVPTVAAALGIRRHPRRSLVDTVVESIRVRRALLILDNLEQLPGAGPIVADLLARSTNLRVLATSRATLHVRGEHEYPLGPLGLPGDADDVSLEQLGSTESVALFVERARAADPRFELSPGNARTIGAICRRLDGLPLAIELAAARSRLLSPEALLRRLDQRLVLLTAGPTDAPERHRTLRDTIDWSYALLPPAEQVVFARLGIFVGGFDVRAADAVVCDPSDGSAADLLGILGRLVDQSLVRVTSDRDGEPRFGLLETIREFALERLDPGEAEDLRRRHAAQFADFAETAASVLGAFGHRPRPPAERATLEDEDQVRWLDRVWRDVDNLRAAFEWARERGEATLLARLAVALARFFGDFGDHRESGNWLHAAEEHMGSLEPALRADLLFHLASHEIWHGGDRSRVGRMFSECLEIRESIGDEVGAAYALIQLSGVAADLGDRHRSVELQRRALSVVDRVDDPVEAARLFVWFGLASAVLDPAEAKSRVEEAVARGRAVGDPATIAHASLSLGWSALTRGDLETAVAALTEARELFADVTARAATSEAISTLGLALLRAGDVDAARELIRDGCARARAGQVWVVLSALEAAADWLGGTGDSAAATVCWAVVDAARAQSPDRTYGNDLGFFEASRERDRRALRPAAYDAARERGARMTLDEGLDRAIAALDGALVPVGPSAPRGRNDLTPREREVLALVAEGRSDGEIAEALFISKKTASVHVASIKGKLGASSRVEMAMLARGREEITASSAR